MLLVTNMLCNKFHLVKFQLDSLFKNKILRNFKRCRISTGPAPNAQGELASCKDAES